MRPRRKRRGSVPAGHLSAITFCWIPNWVYCGRRGGIHPPARLDSRPAIPTAVSLRRIGFAIVLAVGLTLVPFAGEVPQSGKVYRVAVLGLQPAQLAVPFIHALREGLRDLDYVENRNLVLDYLTADGRPERMPEVAAEAVRWGYDVIVTSTNEVTAVDSDVETQDEPR